MAKRALIHQEGIVQVCPDTLTELQNRFNLPDLRVVEIRHMANQSLIVCESDTFDDVEGPLPCLSEPKPQDTFLVTESERTLERVAEESEHLQSLVTAGELSQEEATQLLSEFVGNANQELNHLIEEHTDEN